MPAHPTSPTPACPAAPRRRALRRTASAALAAAVVLVGSAATASAHVRVAADDTAAGGYAELTFSVPTESATASTTALRVELPPATPFTYVATQPVPGWTAVVERGALPEPIDVSGTTITEAATAVVWTAAPGSEVGPGQYQELSIRVGPLPEEGTEVLLPATQIYFDGTVVAWDEPAPASGAEPERPAPALLTTGAMNEGQDAQAEDGTEGAVAAASDTAGTSASPEVSPTSGATADAGARWLGAGGLALGAGALAVALHRGRRPAAAGS